MSHTYMNEPSRKEFEDYVDRVIEPIDAGWGRKRIMRADLMDHLLERYRAERRLSVDELDAARVAIERMGDAKELREQLQASVPSFERVLFLWVFSWFGRKEISMMRWLWIIGVVGFIAGISIPFPNHEFLAIGFVVMMCGLVFGHLYRSERTATGLRGPILLGLIGVFVVLMGTGIILPALAKMKQSQTIEAIQLMAAATGSVIALCGLGYIVFALRRFSISRAIR